MPINPVIDAMMSKYERTKIIGMRMEQLARGAPSTVNVDNMETIREIALKELAERKIPYKVVRTNPDGQKVIWDIKDMIL
jgi:DNA-directed RNA polymerase I, II, and III subunit RPABC2